MCAGLLYRRKIRWRQLEASSYNHRKINTTAWVSKVPTHPSTQKQDMLQGLILLSWHPDWIWHNLFLQSSRDRGSPTYLSRLNSLIPALLSSLFTLCFLMLGWTCTGVCTPYFVCYPTHNGEQLWYLECRVLWTQVLLWENSKNERHMPANHFSYEWFISFCEPIYVIQGLGHK